MAYRYVIKKLPEKAEDSVKFLNEELFPLFVEYWEKYGLSLYGKPIDFDVIQFLQIWTGGSVFLIMAYEDTTAVGFLLGYEGRPFSHKEHVLHVERWYGKTEEVVAGLNNYLKTALSIRDVTEVYIPQYGKIGPQILLDSPVHMEHTIKIYKV